MSTTQGSGGPQTDRLFVNFQDSWGVSSTYHCFAAGLNWSEPVGIIIYTDGSGEWGLNNPNDTYLLDADGSNGLVAVAKSHNMLLLTPMAPGNGCLDDDGTCWYMNSYDGTVLANKTRWSRALVDYIYTQYNIDLQRVAIGGYSSGAQWTTQYFGPTHAADIMEDGVAVAISYGGQPNVTVNHPQSHKDNVAYLWNSGQNDPANSVSFWGVTDGYNWYTNAGFTTNLTIVPGLAHSRSDFDQVMDAAITQWVGAGTQQYDPQTFTTTQVNDTIVLDCSQSPTANVTSYKWFRRTPPTGVNFSPSVEAPIAETAGTSYTDNTITGGNEYEYQVFGKIGGVVVDPSFNSDGVKLSSFETVLGTGTLQVNFTIETNKSVAFNQLVVAVRDSSSAGHDFGHVSPTINGVQSYSPSTTLAAGTYTVWIAYTLDGTTWVNINTPKSVTIGASGGGGGTATRPAMLPTNYSLRFQDEFEGTSIDWSKWEPYGYALTEYGGKTTRRGNKNTNGQLEWNESDNPSNAWVADSVLTFRNRRVTQSHNGITYNWSGNHMTTQPTSAGRFYRNVYCEARVRAQSPIVNGFWPAFWTWQADNAGQGWQEVDIWEWWSAWEGGVRYSANAYQSGNQNGTVVYYANEGTTQATDWNVYGAWIRDDGVRIYLNGDLIASHPNVMQGEQYVIINMANEDNPNVQPPAGVNSYEIYWDWVRIWGA